MKLTISDSALKWFKQIIGVQKGGNIRFYAKLYGSSPVQESYSLGFSKDEDPIDIAVRYEADGILFFIEESDVWYFNGHDLHVEYHEQEDELEYQYIQP
ncbi:HesB/YadR/YfhF family protein [Pseudoneobacillus sp. C159]